jgi:hypothetical protein
MARNARSWTLPLTVSLFTGMTVIASSWVPSHAGPKDDEKQSAGTVLTVPLADYSTIAAQNGKKQKNVNLLQVTQAAVGDLNTQVATISIRQNGNKNGKKWEASQFCDLPKKSLQWVQQANKNTAIIEQSVYGSDNQQISQVEVYQDNEVEVKKGARFMMCPRWAVDSILALNPTNVNLVHITQLAVGDDNSQVAVLSVDQNSAGSVKIPGTAAGTMLQLNLNITIINQIAVGNGNTQVATINVGQGNGL